MSKFHFFAPVLLAMALFMSTALADNVTLKTGEHLEGKITAETDKEITMQVQVSAGITDEKVIPKAQIEKMDKTTPEVEAYQKLIPIQLGKDSMAVAQYDPYIRALQAFVEEYPTSPRAPDVQKTLNIFLEEKKRVEAGEIKMDGQWISKADVKKEKVQIGGQMAFAYMKGQSASGDFIGALNTFAAIEKNFPGAEVMPEAIDLAQKVVIQLSGEVERAIPNQKALVKQQTSNLAAAGPADRAVMAGAIKREADAKDAAVTAAGSNWPPFYPDNEKSLTALETRLKTEGPRLAALPVEKMRESLQLAQEGKLSLASGDVNGAVDKLKDSTTLWPANEYAQRLSKEAQDAQKAAAAAAAATPIPAPVVSVPMTPRPRHITTPMPSADADTSAPATAPSTSGTGTTAATTAPGTTKVASTAPAGDDDDSLVTIPHILGVVVVVAVLLIGLNIYMKKKKRRAEEAGN